MFSPKDALVKAKNDRKHSVVFITYITMACLLVFALILTLCFSLSGREDAKDTQSSDSKVSNKVDMEYTFNDTKTGTLLVINKNTAPYDFTLNPESELASVYENVPELDGKKLYSLRNDSLLANSEALEALNAMIEDFSKQDPDAAKRLTVWTAYRSHATQEALSSSVGAGHSDFHTGMLFEITADGSPTSISTDKAFEWIYENAHKYGFVQRYPEEKSSVTGISDFDNAFRYVGKAHAAYMMQNSLCLEEYVDMLSKSEGRTFSVGRYRISYAKANENETTVIALPRGAKVSGDNMGGLIIATE